MLKKETQFIIYTAPDCPKCVDQKAKWDAEGIRYEERSADRIKNHEDDYDKEAHVEASMNNMELPVIIKLFPKTICRRIAMSKNRWDFFCDTKCKLRERCILELVEVADCPVCLLIGDAEERGIDIEELLFGERTYVKK